MRILVAGATGVIGRELLPILTAAGHEVVGLSRSAPAGAGAWIAADALNRMSLTDAVQQAAPEVVVNLLTSIPADIRPRRLARDFATTSRLRTEGTRNLLDAARDAGATRIICEGLAYIYDPSDAGPASEDAPLWRRPPRQFAPVARALTELERLTAGQDGLVLRFGHLYGPGTAFAEDGSFVRALRAGKVPVVGHGGAVFSFVHARDAAMAVAAAVTRRVRGVLNVVDDVPVAVRDWLPELARQTGAPAPRTAPAALARLAAGGWGVAYMTQLRGADNAGARHLLGWEPRYPSWRDGFSATFAARQDVGSLTAPPDNDVTASGVIGTSSTRWPAGTCPGSRAHHPVVRVADRIALPPARWLYRGVLHHRGPGRPTAPRPISVGSHSGET